MNTTALRTFKFLGNTDEVDTCDCCGRKDLKSTVALENLDTGDVVHFGVVCAARAAAADAEYNRLQTWLDARLPHLRGQRFEQLQALGGMKAVREMVAA